ncbi:hypothetical protein Tco_1184231 [Tanacetum coccineum]
MSSTAAIIFRHGFHSTKPSKDTTWTITEDMKHNVALSMLNGRLFVVIEVPLTQSQPTESNPMNTYQTEMILQDTLQVSLAEHKSHEEQEARENVALVDEHLASEEIDKMVEGQENVVDDSSIPRNDESNIPGTRIEPIVIRKRGNFMHKSRPKLENSIAKSFLLKLIAVLYVFIFLENSSVHPDSIKTSSVLDQQQYSTVSARKLILNCNNKTKQYGLPLTEMKFERNTEMSIRISIESDEEFLEE